MDSAEFRVSESLRLLVAAEVAFGGDFATEVREGLSRTEKALSSCWLYDEQGSLLFEEICAVPEYYLTRAEEEILRERADEILADVPVDAALVELGSGSSTKTQHLIRAMLARRGKLEYLPVDISRTALEESARGLVESFAGLRVTGVVGEYHAGLELLKRELAGPRFVLWLGSSIGNLNRASALDFLVKVRGDLGVADRFLLGVDLRKDAGTLERAYDDAAGVTARFNHNLLARINRELGGHFDLERFQHRAVYLKGEGRVKSSLVSLAAQTVRIDALDLEVRFEAGEGIHTEDSTKYSLAEIDELAERAGFEIDSRWLDGGERYSLQLLRPTLS